MTTVTLWITLTHKERKDCGTAPAPSTKVCLLVYTSFQSQAGAFGPVVRTAILPCHYFPNKCLVPHWKLFSEEVFTKQEQKQRNVNGLQWLMFLNKSKAGERHGTTHSYS